MGCGCNAENTKLFGGARRRRKSSRRPKSRRRNKSVARKKRRVIRGGSLLGDQLTNASTFTSGLIGSSGMPFLHFNPPASLSFNDGNRYVT